MGWGKARTPRQQNQVLWGGGQILGRVGWAGKGNTDFFGVPDPMPAIVRVPQSSGHLFAKPCLHGGGRGGEGVERGILCLCVKTLMGAVRETTPTLIQSPFLGSWAAPLPSIPPPRLSHSIFVCPPTPGGAFPVSPPGPRGGGGSLEGMCGLYGFIYNILKNQKSV